MNRFLKFIAVLASACLVSCEKNSGALFTNASFFGEVQGNTIIVNGTNKYVVTEDETDAGWQKNKRNFFQGDVLNKSEDGGSYTMRIKSYSKVDIREVLTKGIDDPEVYGSNATCLFEDWGLNPTTGLFDISYLVTFKPESETEHTVDLVFDPERSKQDTVFFELHHNAFGESFENEEIETSKLATGIGYTTFNMKPVFSNIQGDSVVISIEWDWFKQSGEAISRETEHQQICGTVRLK